jgi:hypothetical protein
MTRHQGLERRGVLSEDEPLKQLRIGESRDGPIRPEASNLPQCSSQRADGYVS